MFHEASSMQVISCAGLVSLFRPSMFPQHPGGSSRDTRCLMLSHASAVQQSSWVNLYSSTVSHRGRARGIWRHTSASGKEPRNGCKLALAMPYCSVGFGGLLAGPRACDAWSKSCEEALYRWNWNRNQLEGRPRHRSNPQAVGRNAAAAATTGAVQDLGDGVSLVALLLSTAVLIRSLVCKPLSENSDDGIADVEAGMLPTDHAAVVSMMQPCSFWMWPEMEAACKTWSAVPVIPNAPVVCLNRRWQTCWRYTTRPRRGCTTLPATSCRVCMQRTVCRPPLSGRLCRLAWERWLQICHIPSTRPVLLHGTSCKVADTYSTVRLRRSDLWWSLRVGRLLQSPWLLWNTWFLGDANIDRFSRPFGAGSVYIQRAAGHQKAGPDTKKPRGSSARLRCLEQGWCWKHAGRAAPGDDGLWKYGGLAHVPCQLPIARWVFRFRFRRGGRWIEWLRGRVPKWPFDPGTGSCEHMRHAQSAQRRSRRLQQDPAACRPNQKCNNNSEQKCERVEAHMCDILCACLRHEAALLQALRLSIACGWGWLRELMAISWHAFRLVFGYHVMCADSCCALGSL